MPYTDGSLGNSVRESGEQAAGLRKSNSTKGFKSADQASGLKKSNSAKGLKKLTKQPTVESEKRREMLKQESKDSGIVTEMVVRPKEMATPLLQKEYQRSESTSSGSKTKRSFKSKDKSDKIKRSQSVKVKGHKPDVNPNYQRSHDDLEIELLTPKQNGSMDDDQEKKNPSTIRGMWKKAFKTLKSSSSVEKLSKKSSFSKKKQSSKDADDEVEQLSGGPVDPVYSLLKCAADLPRSGGKSPCLLHQHCSGQHTPAYVRYPSGGDSSGNTSKTSSPSSSAVICSNFSGSTNDNVPHSSKPAYLHLDHTSFPDEHTPSTNQSAARSCCHATKSCNHSLVEKLDMNKVYSRIQHKTSPLNTPEASEGETVPCFTGYIRSEVSHSPKTRRKKLNARMKSFSLDTPEPPKQLLGIDESTKKKSSSFTNTCFGVGTQSPEEKFTFSASSLRKKFAFAKASSLEIEEKKNRSFSPSPKGSPKSQKKEIKNLYVALYNFKAKEKDDIDLRAGWRVNVTDSSKKDWWKGKTHGRTGYFPATYVIPLQLDQRVFQVLQPLNLSDGNYSIKFHKDQIVLQIGEEVEGMILVRAANNRQALCPLLYLQEL